MPRPEFASDISREEFDLVRPMLEGARRRTRPRKHDLYDVFCAVLYFIDSGSAWRNLPPDFPPWRTVHEYFTQWTSVRGNQTSLLDDALRQLRRPDLLDKLRAIMLPR
ncbi:MAG TPA: transposase [Burkholderiaceae bacterium]|nr:transposase [Burkholderiaceae bacterium]